MISYDQNGNLTQMTQHGWRPGTASFGMIDDLRYTYNGNQLQAVRDQSTQHGDKDFQDNGATSFQDYTYDAQGSLTADANLGVTAVTYNHLGLTETVTLTGGRQLRYLYAADGTRLARVRVQTGQADLRDDLVGAFAYQGGVLNHILNGEGRIVPAVSPGRQYRHEYHYRDQLGNLRLAFSDLDFDGIAEVSDILQEAHYYPYGLGFSGMATVSNGVASRYTFNGKEAQEAFGMGWIDFGARMYDAQMGRWMAVDGLAEKYAPCSPYSAMNSNPILNVDIAGMEPVKVHFLNCWGPGCDPKANWPTIKPSQWYAPFGMRGPYDDASFSKAAYYNTQNQNSWAYEDIAQRNAYYKWAHQVVGDKSKWFGAADIVTRWNAVGAADRTNAWFMNDQAEDFLQKGNEFLFKYNMINLKLLKDGLLNFSFVDASGEHISFEGLQGKELDYALVKFEQSKVEGFIKQYAKDNPGIDMENIFSSIDSGFKWGYYTLMGVSEIRGVMGEHFEGGWSYDFKNYTHRVELGKKLVDQLYERESK